MAREDRYLVHQLLPQSVHHLWVEAEEHDEGGGRAGGGFMASEQQLRGRLLDGLRTARQDVTPPFSRTQELVLTLWAEALVQYLHAELLSVPGAAVDQLLQSVSVLRLVVRLLQLLLDVLLDLGVDEVSGF